MENRRLFTFLIVSVVTLYLWGSFVAPILFPPEKTKPPVAAEKTEPTESTEPPASVAGTTSAAGTDNAAAPAEVKVADYPAEQVIVGSLSADSGFALEAVLSSKGASIESVRLADPRFRDLKQLDQQIQIVGNNDTTDRSFSTSVDLIDRQLKPFGQTLESTNWKLEGRTDDESGTRVEFSYESPDHSLRVIKSFLVRKLKASSGSEASDEVFRNDPTAHTIEVELKLINLSDSAKSVAYELQGPVGVILENAEHTSKYRDIKLEFLGDEKGATMTAKEIAGFVDDLQEEFGSLDRDGLRRKLSDQEPWTGVFRYAGIDVQFFAALVAPLDSRTEEERLANKWIDRTYPVLIQPNVQDKRLSDISFRMASRPIDLAAAGAVATAPEAGPEGGTAAQSAGAANEVSHKYAFFVGPKRRELLDPEPLAAARVLDYGDWFGVIARGMHRVLDLFHQLGLPYVLSIISLTVLVRGCMFPLSRKQAISAAKMKDLQPKLTELKARFGDDKEKLARAQMELWRKHKINPFGGCLPLFFQLPIFIGLYTSLNTAVDLRLASFLWIDNLAAPDALVRLPFEIPYLGRDFNILPCITVVLFLIQQKMFMPPAADEQQEAQQKMMNFMTIFMGVMFWHQPAGLCVYFIASSLWSIAERKLLGATTKAPSGPDVSVDDLVAAESSSSKPARETTRDQSKEKGSPSPQDKVPPFFRRLLDAANQDQARLGKARGEDDRKKKKK
ncbi:MAG: membrane protein insertase YidC [Planctomyces sp.]|nr:membrane protein insertase YidC [Planctomyces sp.]